MYLQALEIIGFKSFANKTRLVFEPGITAIVGPNGCGKSNISDAIRWVLGEQRPTALRSSAMTDVIFNGTDKHKPLGMTEVSITFADCEKELGTEYNEVTISRRVFRSGEGQYFINKTPCRLRDIQRLFMGTGIGTTSYSVMAQGQIDAILSSRPEDRRAIFEEAAGITRFRADRREAIRKLDQTEANLLRLSDVIRELHRQIGSLQRQAGKARRYKELQGELRKLDLFATTKKILSINESITALSKEIGRIQGELETLREQVENGEVASAEIREKLMDSERRIGVAMEQAMEAQGRCNTASESMRVNLQRIDEYKAWTERDEKEIAETNRVRLAQETSLKQHESQYATLESELAEADKALAKARAEFDLMRDANAAARNELQRLRNESVETERLHISLQNELSASENSARENLLKNERLSGEKARLEELTRSLKERLDEIDGETETLNSMVDAHSEAVLANERKTEQGRKALRECEREEAELQSRMAAQSAKIQVLSDAAADASDSPAGTALIADPANTLGMAEGSVLGPIAEQFTAPESHRAALEAVLRAWADAVAVRTLPDAAAAVAKLQETDKNAGARIFVADAAGFGDASKPSLPRLLDHVEYKETFKTAAENLLGNVYIVDSLEAIPSPYPDWCSFVTLRGAAVFPGGMVEMWSAKGSVASPLARHMMTEDAKAVLAKLELETEEASLRSENIRKEVESAVNAMQTARGLLDQSRRAAAQKEGERNMLSADLQRTSKSLADAVKALKALGDASKNATEHSRELAGRLAGMGDSRKRIADAVEAQGAIVHEAETKFLEAQTALTEARLAQASISHRAETARSQRDAAIERIAELERMATSRTAGIKSYEKGIQRLASENQTLEKNLAELEAEVVAKKADADALRVERANNKSAADQAELVLQNLRRALDEAGTKHNRAEVSHAEAKMRLQNIQDRLMTDWHITIPQLASESLPDWGEEGEPALDAAEVRIAEIRAKMEEMGPVNLVAIEEYQEIEERHAFLTEQEADLTNGRTKLLELIKDIDKQSTELFTETFEKAKANFQTMFERLFDGGTAQLALMDDENLLECGIDIVARPPGKKPQTIALLSGGERTLTAVALLFAIYMIKPSPFALLDEIDAALDDSNIGRFVGVLKDFLEQSQFIIITHNQHTIAGADIVYGVTQEEHGISKIISMRLKRVGVEELKGEELPEVAAPAPPSKRKMKKYESV